MSPLMKSVRHRRYNNNNNNIESNTILGDSNNSLPLSLSTTTTVSLPRTTTKHNLLKAVPLSFLSSSFAYTIPYTNKNKWWNQFVQILLLRPTIHKQHKQQQQQQQNNRQYQSQIKNGIIIQSKLTLVYLILVLVLCSIYIPYKVIDYLVHWYYLPCYESYNESNFRNQRFPSIDDRIKLYMSNWYLPPCNTTTSTTAGTSSDDGFVLYQRKVDTNNNCYYILKDIDHTGTNTNTSDSINITSTRNILYVTKNVIMRRIFFMTIDAMDICYKQTTLSIRYYCLNSIDSIMIPLLLLNKSTTTSTGSNSILQPIQIQFTKYIASIIGWTNTIHYFYNNNNNININNELPPILGQFSDETDSYGYTSLDRAQQYINPDPISTSLVQNPNIPIIKKIRYSIPYTEIQQLTKTISIYDDPYQLHKEEENTSTGSEQQQTCIQQRLPPTGLSTLQPIIWFLNIDRHFKATKMVKRWDIPYEHKKDAVVFRGLLTGFLSSNNNTTSSNSTSSTNNNNDYENCLQLIRCNVVYKYANSTIVDAKLTSTFNKVSNSIINNRSIIGNTMKQYEMLQYKGIICIEGNDVSSGLKWIMMSNSVVLMRKPIYTSWAMEELLQPFVHYIPLNNNYDNIEEMTYWIIQHPEETKRIIRRANLWILDLYYHKNSLYDNYIINKEIIKRYYAHFKQM